MHAESSRGHFFFDDDFRDLRDEVFLRGDLRDLRDDAFLRGTLPPARRACASPIAIACLRLFTFFPERPLRSVPRFRSCIAFFTFSWAFRPYFAMNRSSDLRTCM
jgi:hypothetical protein